MPTITAKSSFADLKAKMFGQSTSNSANDNGQIADTDKVPADDPPQLSEKAEPRQTLAKKRSKYFEGAFAVKEVNPAKERVHNAALVIAEVRTSVMIKDEYTFITELAYNLSARYQRPVSSIVITLQHGHCLFFAGNFEAAYVMSIYALPSQLQPATNRRNAALIQEHVGQALDVEPARGFLRFVPFVEDQCAWKGNTIAAEIEDLGKGIGNTNVDDTGSPASRKEGLKRQLSARAKSLGTFHTATVASAGVTPSTSGSQTPPFMAPPTLHLGKDLKAGKVAKRKKSFVANLFGRSSPKPEYRP